MSGISIYDVAIIGAGAVGCALARELSRYQLDILLLEASDDVATGATRANSGIVHGGYAAKAGSRKAEFCHAGNRLFPSLAAELNFPYRNTGSVVLAFSDADLESLERTEKNGHANGVMDLEQWSRTETLRRIPRLNPDFVRGALYSPGTGIVSPYEYAIALAENAIANGVTLRLHSEVTALESVGADTDLLTADVKYRARFVINAAGAGAGAIAALAAKSAGVPTPFTINPRKGQYIVFRRGSAAGLDMVVFQAPTEKGKGILVTPTTWDNLLLGPDAQEVQDPTDLGTDPESLARIIETARMSVKDFNVKDAIRVFSGMRPASDRGDFIIEWSDHFPGLLHLAGIESPGLTASPAIALEAVRLLKDAGLGLADDPTFNPRRHGVVKPGPLGAAAEAARAASLPPGDPERIVCRCEQIRESMIREALNRGIELKSTDAVKRRTRAGMGACQGVFCGPRVRSLIAGVSGFDEARVRGPSRDRIAIKADLDEMRHILAMRESVESGG